MVVKPRRRRIAPSIPTRLPVTCSKVTLNREPVLTWGPWVEWYTFVEESNFLVLWAKYTKYKVMRRQGKYTWNREIVCYYDQAETEIAFREPTDPVEQTVYESGDAEEVDTWMDWAGKAGGGPTISIGWSTQDGPIINIGSGPDLKPLAKDPPKYPDPVQQVDAALAGTIESSDSTQPGVIDSWEEDARLGSEYGHGGNASLSQEDLDGFVERGESSTLDEDDDPIGDTPLGALVQRRVSITDYNSPYGPGTQREDEIGRYLGEIDVRNIAGGSRVSQTIGGVRVEKVTCTPQALKEALASHPAFDSVTGNLETRIDRGIVVGQHFNEVLNSAEGLVQLELYYQAQNGVYSVVLNADVPEDYLTR